MATVGDQLLQPEEGWRRVDDTHEDIDYIGTSWGRYVNLNAYNQSTMRASYGDGLRFNFTGDKIRIIAPIFDYYSSHVEININGTVYNVPAVPANIRNQHQSILFEKTDLFSENYITITNKDESGSYFRLDAIDIVESGEIKPFSVIYQSRMLIRHNNQYKRYNTTTSSWEVVTSATPAEVDYLQGNSNEEINFIPEDAWQEFSDEVEILYYTQDTAKTETIFNIETEPFTLFELLDGQDVKIIEYTDDPNQTESSVTIETEPFTLYEELGDSAEILYYTDDPNVTDPKIVIDANYSPLDELDGDFEVVTWTDEVSSEDDELEKHTNMTALPFNQLIIHPENIETYGELQSFVSTIVESAEQGTIRFLLSHDEGANWGSYSTTMKWKEVDINSTYQIVRYGLTPEQLNNLEIKPIMNNGELRIAYYIDERQNIEESAKIEEVKIISSANTNDVKFSDLAFYLLNTTATINVRFIGNKITGVLDDADKGKVKYRVLLNNEAYFPESGQFTTLIQSPADINIVVDDRRIRFGEENSLRVEFQDYWGQVDHWSVNFIGTPSGLLFTDQSGEYYSTAFGEVLKYLDFGQIIAGQTTIDQKVILVNNIGYDVKDVQLMAVQPEQQGVEVELSKEQSPFIPSDILSYEGVFPLDGQIEFYVRLTSQLTAEPTANGKFAVRVVADRA